KYKGINGRQLQIFNSHDSDKRYYRCYITSGITGTADSSDAAYLLVKPIPPTCAPAQSPNSRFINANCPMLNCNDVRYLWYRDGVFLAGEEKSTLIIVEDDENKPSIYELTIVCDG